MDLECFFFKIHRQVVFEYHFTLELQIIKVSFEG